VKVAELGSRVCVVLVLLELRVLDQLADHVGADAIGLLDLVHLLVVLGRVHREARKVDDVESKGAREQAAEDVLLVLERRAPRAPLVVLEEDEKGHEATGGHQEHVLGMQVTLQLAKVVTLQELNARGLVHKVHPGVHANRGTDAREKAHVATVTRLDANLLLA